MTPRAHPWWHAVVSRADDPTAPDPATPADGSYAAGVREPWAGRALETAALTTAQQAVLAGLDDQPDVPTLDDITRELAKQPGTTESHWRAHVATGTDPGHHDGGLDSTELTGTAGAGELHGVELWGPGRSPAIDGGATEGAEEVGADQPGVPRLRGGRRPGTGPGNGTGDAPGDRRPADPHTRTRWTEQEQQEG